MRTKLFSSILFCTLAVFCAASATAAQDRTAGRILAAKVRGSVTATNKADNATKQLHDSDAISEGYVVTTAAKSSVILVFANGASVNLGEDSSLSIDEFLMDPFDPKYSIAEAKDEPSTSVTKLSLARGEFVTNVKHLRRESGSSFTVNTPVGAAGIRGTTFRLVVVIDDQGKAHITLSTSEGLVGFLDLEGADHLVPAGQQFEITFDVYTNDRAGRQGIVPGSVRITGLSNIPAATQAEIARVVAQMLAAHGADLGTSGAPDATRPPEDTTPGDGRSPGGR